MKTRSHETCTETEEVDSSRQTLYQNVISLDKSDLGESLAGLSAVFELLHIDVNDLEEAVRSPKDQVISSRPSERWALRWLLRRLSVTNEAGPQLQTNYRAWLLFYHLIRTLQTDVVHQLLKSHGFLVIVRRALERIQALIQPGQTEDLPQNGCGSIDTQQEWSLFAIRAPGDIVKEPSKSKKRKRARSQPVVSDTAPARCFYYIIRTIVHLQMGDKEQSYRKSRLCVERNIILDAEPLEVPHIVASGLTILSHILQITSHVDSDIKETFGEDLLEPLLRLREKSVQGAVPADIAKIATETLKRCTLPALHLLYALERAPVSLKLKFQQGRLLRDTIAQTFIHPFRISQHEKTRKPATTDGEPEMIRDDIESIIEETLRGASEEAPQVLEILFNTAFDCVRRENAFQRSREDPWLQQLFELLMQSVNGQARAELLTFAQMLLTIANAHKLQIQTRHLTNLFEAVTKDLTHDWKIFEWTLAALVVENNTSIFTSRQSESVPMITEGILREASLLCDSANSAKATDNPANAGHSTYNFAMQRVLLPLVRLYGKGRDIETFIMLWSQNLEQCITNTSDTAVQKMTKVSTIFNSVWTDERLLYAISEQLASSISSTRRLELLETSTRGLEEEKENTLGGLQFLMLIDCLIAICDLEDLRFLQGSSLAKQIASSILNWLDSDKLKEDQASSETKTCRWRAWRLLSDLVVKELVDPSDIEQCDTLKMVSTMVRQGFDQQEAFNLTEVAMAWIYLLRYAIQVDPTLENEVMIKHLRKPWKKIVGLNAKKLDFAEPTCPDFHVEIRGPSQLAQHCIVTAAEISPGTPWLEELFTDEIIALVQKAAARESTKRFSEDLPSPSGWQHLWSSLNSSIWQKGRDCAIRDRLSSQHVTVWKGLQDPGKGKLDQLRAALESADELKTTSLKSTDRQDLIEILDKWLDSDLWTFDDANETLNQTHGLLNRLEDQGQSCATYNRHPTGKDPQSNLAMSSISPKPSDLQQQKQDAIASLSIAQSLRRRVQASSSEEDKQVLSAELKSAFWKAGMVLETTTSTHVFVLAAKTIDVILKCHQVSAIGQLQIDELLALIAFITSPQCKLNAIAPDAVYTCLCDIFGRLLSDYRHRINGRYHLILVALKGLFWSLFESQEPGAHARWLEEQPEPLTLSCAELFSRLLESLSEPTVSAARVGNRQSKLNDQTKKAKSIAGQHLSQLIICFCSFQLQGRLSPLARDKVDQGLYAIMNAMSQDVMQHINSAMDSSEKAIFKGLYDDWRRFGRSRG